ncbi:extracellular solute-binding protein [Clostridium lacusfryxellense]|uniref:extracellular solute-binding protein n=1 Tax=Clostridium lacusfryxellense TaxID=205328 RepID=UPI001C0D6F07|nr:extracellular solute-binding protein [Clostridium lacusfryxellense]MBU3113410.1 extracellular solute-binding protein [Clostridium lacusfryxellense]
MKNNKVLLTVLSSIMATSIIFTGCQGTKPASKPSATADSSWTFGSSPLEFSFYVNYDWYAPKGYGSTQQTKWLIDKEKLTVNEISSNGNAAQKFGAMVAGNELPDVIQMDGGAQFESLARSGKLVALDDYVNNPKYPSYKKLVDANASNLMKVDGKTYGISNWFGNKKATRTNNKGWVVNRKIYKDLGSPKLDTFEDLYSYLKLVKAKYPDVVPLDSANTNGGVVQVQNMLYVGEGENNQINFSKSDSNLGFAVADLNKKQYTSIFEDTGFKDSYMWTNKFFREKLMTQDLFTQKSEQFKEKLNNGKIAVAGFYDVSTIGDQANKILQAKDPEAGYDFIPYIHKDGVDVNKLTVDTGGAVGWNFNCITTKAKEPEKIFAAFDWMLSDDGIRMLTYGPKGELWDTLDAKGAPIANDKFKNMKTDELNALKLGDFVPEGSWRIMEMETARELQAPDTIPWARKADLFYGKWNKFTGDELYNVGNYKQNSEEDAAYIAIKDLNTQYCAKVVFAKTDVEFNKIMDDWKAAVTKAGYDKLLTVRNAQWAANLKTVGTK